MGKMAYCSMCDKEMEVDQDGTCMECGTGIAWPKIYDKEHPAPKKKSKKA